MLKNLNKSIFSKPSKVTYIKPLISYTYNSIDFDDYPNTLINIYA